MSTETLQQSIWQRIDGNKDKSPKYCPHCGDELAHPDNLRENEDVDAVSRSSAYRAHREAHYEWGVDPALTHEGGDPYLAKNYDGIDDGTGRKADPEEEVAGVYDVEINYEAVLRARVVAVDKHQAKERAKDLRLSGEECAGGYVPDTEITHEVHDSAREVQTLTRQEVEHSSEVDEDEDKGINWAERLPGWPW